MLYKKNSTWGAQGEFFPSLVRVCVCVRVWAFSERGYYIPLQYTLTVFQQHVDYARTFLISVRPLFGGLSHECGLTEKRLATCVPVQRVFPFPSFALLCCGVAWRGNGSTVFWDLCALYLHTLPGQVKHRCVCGWGFFVCFVCFVLFCFFVSLKTLILSRLGLSYILILTKQLVACNILHNLTTGRWWVRSVGTISWFIYLLWMGRSFHVPPVSTCRRDRTAGAAARGDATSYTG